MACANSRSETSYIKMVGEDKVPPSKKPLLDHHPLHPPPGATRSGALNARWDLAVTDDAAMRETLLYSQLLQYSEASQRERLDPPGRQKAVG